MRETTAIDLAKKGEKVLFFDTFPLDIVPKMVPLRIEKLTNKEIDMYKRKLAYIRSWENIEDLNGIDKFIVTHFAHWYLVRIYEG